MPTSTTRTFLAVLGFSALATTAAVARPVGIPTQLRAPVTAPAPYRATYAAPVGPDTQTHPTEIGNWWVLAPPPSYPAPTDFEVVFTGDVTGDIPANEPLWGIYNPFCPPAGPSHPCPPTVTFNPTANTTTVEYSGTTLYQNNAPPHQNQYHFGLLRGTTGSNIKCFTRTTEWTFASAPPVPTPFVNVANCNKHKGKGKTMYAIVYIEASFQPITPSSPPTFGGWYEIGYQSSGSQQPKFTFSNGGKIPIYVGISGIILNQPVPGGACLKTPICSANMKLLQQLNFGGEPPPGQPGSQFIPMTYPPPSQL